MKFYVHVVYGHCSDLLWCNFDTLCTFSFMEIEHDSKHQQVLIVSCIPGVKCAIYDCLF